MKKLLPYLYIVIAACCWGGIGLFNRRLLAAGLTPLSIVALRNIGGMLLLALVFALFDRTVFRIRWRHLPIFFGSGVVSVLFFSWCYFSCQQQASLAVAAILLYTAPAFVVLLSALLWKEPVSRRKLLSLLLTLVGCTLVAGLGGGALSPRGLLLGLGAGLFYALYSIFARYGLAHYRPYTVTLWTFIFCGIGSLPLADWPAVGTALRAPGLGWSLSGLIVISTVLPYLLYTQGLSRVEAGRASITASVEPVAAALIGVLAFHESLSLRVLGGMLCVLTGVCLLALEKPQED